MVDEIFDKKWEKSIWTGTPYADMPRLLKWAQNQRIKRKIPRRLGDWAQFSGRKFQQVRGISRHALYKQAALFERFDGTRLITIQPFKKDESISSCNSLLNWCFLRGLQISYVTEELSWFKPGQSVLYQIELKDEAIYIEYIKSNKRKAHFCWFVE
jgi:hypothetical protein